jgi:Protein of unknown function (DUF2971)
MSYSALPIRLFSSKYNIPETNDAIDLFNKNWLSNHSTENELTLYHYTTLEGLKGIIANRSIWCTQIYCLSDPFEFEYGRELILNKLNEFIEKERNDLIKKILIGLQGFSGYAGRLSTHNIFIACFCEKDNLLSQWRGYAAKGGGYNLGISFDTGTKLCNDVEKIEDTIPVNLRKVIYDPQEQNRIIELFLNMLIEGIKKAELNWKKYSVQFGIDIESQVELPASNILADMMISMKNPAFVEEKEWRLVRFILWNEIPEMYKFRENNNELIPYLNTYLFRKNNDSPEFPLKRIVFGPMLEKLKTRVSLDLFCRNNATSFHNIKLNKSTPIESAGFVLR